MPAKTVLFDAKANPVHDLGLSPRNFLCYQPQSRLLLVAGFGNLSGAIDVWDRKTMKKVAEILAPNATVCEWSPDGNYIMTATLSPRLRVDNGLKIWWCGGGLLHQELIPELYQVCFLLFLSRQRLVARSLKLKFFPTYFSFVGSLAAASPLPMPSLPRYYPQAPKPVAAGAYRPPGARGTSTPTIFLREDQGGLPSTSSPAPSPAYAARSAQQGRRAPPGSAPKEEGEQVPGQGQGKKKKGGVGSREKRKNAREGGGQNGLPMAEDNVILAPPVEVVAAPAAPPAPEAVDPVQKKIRNLSKKVRFLLSHSSLSTLPRAKADF
jgi:translation initiation factor 2A